MLFVIDEDALRYGVTAVENRFILEYLPAARGDYVKVYLWGLMHALFPAESDSLPEMAAALNMTVAEVEAALRYWERRALCARIREDPPLYRFYSPAQRQETAGSPLQADSEYVMFAESVYAAFGDRRKITPGEIALAWEWVTDVGLRPEAVLMLLSHCIAQRGVQFSFLKAEPLAVRMKEENVVTPEDAEAFLRHDQTVQDGAKKVLTRMGKRRQPSEDELRLYEKWIGAWGFSPDAVLESCAETTKGDPSFQYLDGILNGLRQRGDARTGDAVRQQLTREKDEAEQAREVFSRFGGRLSVPSMVRFYRQYAKDYPHEIMVLAARECEHYRNAKVDDFGALLESWSRRGLKTGQEVTEYLAGYREANAALRAVFEACGHQGRPTEADRALYEKWKGMGYDRELILFAAEQARAAEGSKIAYLDKVLETWHEAGITDITQARARKPGEKPRRGGKTVSAQQYGQREYTEEELMAVSGDLIEEAKNYHG